MADYKYMNIWNLLFKKEMKSTETLRKKDKSMIWNAHQMNRKLWQWSEW